MKRSVLTILFIMIAILGHAQYGNYVQLSALDLLQYQMQKNRKQMTTPPFRRYGMRRIRASKIMEDNDPRQIWGWQIHPNENYQTSEPLYKLFQRNNLTAMAVVDTKEGKTEIIFWDKLYYRRFAQQLRTIGFVMRNTPRATNILEFRKLDVSVTVDVEIWSDIYLSLIHI